MKFIVFSDLHIHNYKQFNEDGKRLDNCIKTLFLIFEYADKNNIDKILFAGDLLDQQQSIPTEVINEVVNCFLQLAGQYPNIHLVSISGNHDHAQKNLFDVPAITAQTFVDMITPNMYLIDNTYWSIGTDIRVHGIPYYSYRKDFDLALEDSKKFLLPNGKNYLMIHQTPQGIKNQFIPTDIDLDIHGFDHIFCGHIHQHQRLNKIFTVVGSPLHRDLGDVGEDNGFLVYDTDAEDFERILVDMPKFEMPKPDVLPSNIGGLIQKEDAQDIIAKYDKSTDRSNIIENYLNDMDIDDEDTLKLGLKFIS